MTRCLVLVKTSTLIIMALLLTLGLAGCRYDTKIPDKISMLAPAAGFEPEVEITDVYCTASGIPDADMFEYRFTLRNLKNEGKNIKYYWSLNDPKADGPGKAGNTNASIARVYQGQQQLSLPKPGAASPTFVTLNVRETRKYDPRFYVMYVSVYRDNKQIGFYREQKSPFDWDYSAAPENPPVIKMKSISISPAAGSYLVNSDNVSSEVWLNEVEIIRGVAEKPYTYTPLSVAKVEIGQPILIVSGSIQNKHPENKEIAMWAAGYDAGGNQVAWTLDEAHIGGQIGLRLEREESGRFTLHLNNDENIRSIRIFANNYNQVPP